MKRMWLALLLVATPLALPTETNWFPRGSALAQDSAKEAFEAAKELGTIEAWQAFLKSYPTGFYADLARAYLVRLAGPSGAPGAPQPAPAASAPQTAPTASGSRQPAPTALTPQTASIPLGPNADLGGRLLLPADSPWHRDVSQDPVDPRSQRILARVGLNKNLHADFGTEYEGAPIGIPFVVVAGTQARVPITFMYHDESDPGPYPIPPNAPIEGGPNGTGDRHIIVLERDSWTLYEIFNAFPDGRGGWKADGGAIWDLKKNQVRPDRWTSADAAGLPILPGLVRYDEVFGARAIEHALRFTLAKTRRAYVPPASHWASEAHDEDLAPMGMRVRLKANYDISGFAPEVRVILTAMKKYGMIMADNGSDNFVSGVPDPRWNNDTLRQLRRIQTKDLEVVEMKGLVVDPRR